MRHWQMQIRQRIFNRTNMQLMHFILDVILKLLTYYAFLSLVVTKLCDLKNSPVFLAHPVCGGMKTRSSAVTEKPRDVLCLSVVNFDSTMSKNYARYKPHNPTFISFDSVKVNTQYWRVTTTLN